MATIPYADIRDPRPLPVDARNICTKVTLVIAGRPSGRDITRVMARDDLNTIYTHYPLPIVVEVELDEHSVYHAHKVFQLPEGVNPFVDPTSELINDPNQVGVGFVSELRDGDPETNVEITVDSGIAGSADPTFVYVAQSTDDEAPIVGWRIMYTFNANSMYDELDSPHVLAERWMGIGGTQFVASFTAWNLPYMRDATTVVDLWATAHVDARATDDGDFLDRLNLIYRGVLGESVITHFYPLILNVPYLENIARAHLRLPAANPTQVTVVGHVPFEEFHTITDWPGGDLTLPVARQTYRRGETIIDFEQAGAPQGITAAAYESARIRRIREAEARHTALYGVRMSAR